MRKDKEIAEKLRKDGRSYSQISAQLNIPKSTLSNWFQYNAQSQQVKNFLNAANRGINKVRLARLHKIRGEELRALYAQAEDEAVKEFEYLKYHPLFIAALMIYWGEGDKGQNLVRVTNSEPAVIEVFIQFLREIGGVEDDKIKLHLLLYPDLEDAVLREYWAKEVGHSNFNKSVVIQGRHKTRKLKYGVCHVTVCSSYLKKKMLKWLSLLPEALLSSEYYKVVS